MSSKNEHTGASLFAGGYSVQGEKNFEAIFGKKDKTAIKPTSERPMLFNGDMVRAILEGRKTQTRREVKLSKHYSNCHLEIENKNLMVVNTQDQEARKEIYCPYGSVGDQLWVRETFGLLGDEAKHVLHYRATHYRDGKNMGWKPSIHMPRWASRIQLEITGIRVERLNDCSESDAKAEGVKPDNETSKDVMDGIVPQLQHKEPYMRLWEKINGAGSWAANPWVWVIEFKVVKP